VYLNELGIPLDEDNLFVVEDGWGSAIDGSRPLWVEVKCPEKYDAVLMYQYRGAPMPTHVGIYAGDGKVLHMRRKTGAVAESIDGLRRAGLVEGFYRFKGLNSIA
jgi:hypothetical protein